MDNLKSQHSHGACPVPRSSRRRSDRNHAARAVDLPVVEQGTGVVAARRDGMTRSAVVKAKVEGAREGRIPYWGIDCKKFAEILPQRKSRKSGQGHIV